MVVAWFISLAYVSVLRLISSRSCFVAYAYPYRDPPPSPAPFPNRRVAFTLHTHPARPIHPHPRYCTTHVLFHHDPTPLMSSAVNSCLMIPNFVAAALYT